MISTSTFIARLTSSRAGLAVQKSARKHKTRK